MISVVIVTVFIKPRIWTSLMPLHRQAQRRNSFPRIRYSLSLNSSLEPDVISEKQIPIPSTPNYRIHVEMLQLAVLIVMPSPHNSPRKNSTLEKLNLDPDDDEKESDDVLPEMVLDKSYRLQPRPTCCGSDLILEFSFILSSPVHYCC